MACGSLLVDQMNVGGAGLNIFYINSYVFVLMCIREKLTNITSPVFHGCKYLELVKRRRIGKIF